jgi:hypothetical protein
MGKSGSLPLPPAPPRGHWRDPFDYLNMKVLDRTFPVVANLPTLSGDFVRDPNRFYWKTAEARRPNKLLQLECQQWRHGSAAETFTGLFSLDADQERGSGVLECHVHAENLSSAQEMSVSVTIDVSHESVMIQASLAVDDLIKRGLALG